jgi:predicted transcriptional regulator
MIHPLPEIMTQHKLIVTVESIGTVQQRTATAVDQALADDTQTQDVPRRPSFETTDQPASVFTPRAIDLLKAIAQHEPDSIREAARLVERDIKQVSDNLERLAAYEVIEFVDAGRAKQPVVPFDEIDIQLPLGGEPETDAAPA